MSDILQKVMEIVMLAKQEILATMDLSEELEKPLPAEYFFLLSRKMQEGVVVKRLAFGTDSNFKTFNNKNDIRSENYECVLATNKNYKRMILIDRKYLFFAKETRGRRNFFFTTEKKCVKEFLDYFSCEFKKGG
ncbi:MAG: hypothetical protein Q8N55_04490 [bacterium]|nr:hypothetical protein [bacterium]